MEDKYVVGAKRNLPSEKDVEHVEHVEVAAVPPTKAQLAKTKTQKHFKRFWCCYLLALIIFLAIFLPIL